MRPALATFAVVFGAFTASADEFQHDFRTGMPAPNMMGLVGPAAHKSAKQGPEGLRIHLEDGRKATGPVGVIPKFGLRGDFSITLEYELLNVANTESGFGAGINLWIGAASAREDEASLGRFARNNQSMHIATRSAKDEQGKMKTKSESVTTEAKKGKLRIERTGTTLRYSVSEDGSVEFVEVHKCEFVRDDIRSVRMVGNTGRTALALDFRITEVTLHAHEFIDPDAARSEVSWWKWVAVNGAGLAVLLMVGVWFYRRRRSRPSLNASFDKPRIAGGPPASAT